MTVQDLHPVKGLISGGTEVDDTLAMLGSIRWYKAGSCREAFELSIHWESPGKAYAVLGSCCFTVWALSIIKGLWHIFKWLEVDLSFELGAAQPSFKSSSLL